MQHDDVYNFSLLPNRTQSEQMSRFIYGTLLSHHVLSFILVYYSEIQTIRQIVKETIGVGVNEKAVLRFYQTALSFTSISIFPW